MKRFIAAALVLLLCLMLLSACGQNSDDAVYSPLVPVAIHEAAPVQSDGRVPFSFIGGTIYTGSGTLPLPTGFEQDAKDPDFFYSTMSGDLSMIMVQVYDEDTSAVSMISGEEELGSWINGFIEAEIDALVDLMMESFPEASYEITVSEITQFGENTAVHIVIEMVYDEFDVRIIIVVLTGLYTYTIAMMEALNGYGYWDEEFYSCLARAVI